MGIPASLRLGDEGKDTQWVNVALDPGDPPARAGNHGCETDSARRRVSKRAELVSRADDEMDRGTRLAKTLCAPDAGKLEDSLAPAYPAHPGIDNQLVVRDRLGSREETAHCVRRTPDTRPAIQLVAWV